jgi:uncharacterized protein (TIGR03435 family)
MKRIVLLAAASSVLLGQQQPTAFEVASVKIRPKGGLISVIGGSPSGPRLTLEAMSLSDLVSWAYNVKPWQVEGGPAWAGAGVRRDRGALDPETSRFDVVAKAEGDGARPVEEFRRMLQTLLGERFHLAMHRDTREVPVYALVIDRNGPKFHQSSAGGSGVFRLRNGTLTATAGTMSQLTDWFSNTNGVDRPIVDRTGLSGHYDFTLQWSDPFAAGASDSQAPSIFTAMPEQLGLKLEPGRAPLEILVIDSATLPDPN